MKHIGGNNYTLQNVVTLKFLHRPDVKIDVFPGTDTTYSIDFRNAWNLKVLSADGIVKHNTTIKLKSWFSDYLHRGEKSLITTWGVGQGNKWILEIVNGKDPKGYRIRFDSHTKHICSFNLSALAHSYCPGKTCLKIFVPVYMNVSF